MFGNDHGDFIPRAGAELAEEFVNPLRGQVDLDALTVRQGDRPVQATNTFGSIGAWAIGSSG